MKREWIIVLILLVSLINFSIAEEPASPVSDEEMQNIQNGLDQIPLDESGNIDPDKLNNYTSKAEQRIAEINKFLDKISWMKYIIGVEPKISGLFLLNILLIIVFLIFLKNSLEFSSFSNNTTTIISICLVAVLIQAKFIFNLSNLIVKLLKSWWFYAIVIVLFVIIAKLAGEIGKYAEARKKKIAEENVMKMSKHSGDIEKGARDAKVVSAVAEGISESFDEERTTKDEF